MQQLFANRINFLYFVSWHMLKEVKKINGAGEESLVIVRVLWLRMKHKSTLVFKVVHVHVKHACTSIRGWRRDYFTELQDSGWMIYVSGEPPGSFELADVCRMASFVFLGQLHPTSQKQYYKLEKVH